MPASYTAPPLPRIPLVPQSVLKAHGVDCIIDTRFRAAARLLQHLWLKDNNIATGVHVRPTEDGDIVTPLGSLLSPDAAHAGRNFLSPAIHAYVRRSLLLREENAMIDESRLFQNSLSSMPLSYNLFAPLAMDLELASRVFRKLFPAFVSDVLSIRFETSPGRYDMDLYLGDGTAFDLALEVTTPDGERATIFVEQKFSEDPGTTPTARWRPRYGEASRQVGLFRDPEAQLLRSPMLDQLWRLAMLSQLSVNAGVTTHALLLGVGPRYNRRVQTAFRCFANQLIPEDDLPEDRVRFRAITLETVIDAIHQAGAAELAKKLWARYCDFERVFHLAMAEYTQPQADGSNKEATEFISNASAPRPRTRRSRAENESRSNADALKAPMRT
jgi:hypothetical protein